MKKIKENEVPTKEKIMIPVRISGDLYKHIRRKVNKKKEKERGYSINKYVAELLVNSIENDNKGGNK